MPHASMPATGFQTFILCGAGASLDPFNSNPRDFPKALIPIANRPMVWYPLEWCYRMGISSIYLITPPEAQPSLEAALSQNPYLTSLPSPKASILAPPDLELTTGTAAIFRLPEVQEAITSNFIVLPCDLVCELNGLSLLEAWMTLQGQIPGTNRATAFGSHGRHLGGMGGLGVWYETRDNAEGGVAVKKEETDMVATASLEESCLSPHPPASLHNQMQVVVLNMTKDTLNDKINERETLRVRKQLIQKHGCVKMYSSLRDAHIYLFPHWTKTFMASNDAFDSLGEDVVGWWAKSRWQAGLSRKLSLPEAITSRKRRKSEVMSDDQSDEIDTASLSSTSFNDLRVSFLPGDVGAQSAGFSGVDPDSPGDENLLNHDDSMTSRTPVPPILGYIHPAHTANSPNVPSKHLIRRIDTVALLLSSSLYLARQPQPDSPASPFAHPNQTHPTTTIPPHTTIHSPTVLLDANVDLSQRITLRECVIGANCSIASGVRLTRCVLMEGVVVKEKVVMHGCVLGKRCQIGKGSELRECNVQDGFAVSEGTTAKGEVMAGFGEEGELLESEDEDRDEW